MDVPLVVVGSVFAFLTLFLVCFTLSLWQERKGQAWSVFTWGVLIIAFAGLTFGMLYIGLTTT